MEEANRALVESCNGFLDSMSESKNEAQFGNAMVRASDALLKANRFSSVISANCRGHARFRRSAKTQTSVPQTGLLDSLVSKTDRIVKSGSFDENLTKNLLKSSSLNLSAAKTVLFAETSAAKDLHSLQPVKFHQNLNVEPGSSSKSLGCLDLSPMMFHRDLDDERGLSSKSLACLDLSSMGKSSPGLYHPNLSDEPGLLDLSSNGKSRRSVYHQNLNAEPGLSTKSSVCLDFSSNSVFHRNLNSEPGLMNLSSNGKSHPGLFHQYMNLELGSSSKSSVCLDLSSPGKPPLHRAHQAPTPFQFHQHLQQKLQYQKLEQLKYHQKMKTRAETLSHGRINLDGSCYNPTISSSRSLMSSLSVEGSVSNINEPSIHHMADPGALGVRGLCLKRKCSGFGGSGSVHCGSNRPSGSSCHCAKKRRNKLRRTIIVPAISNKIADIPPDEYSWRKYGQKPIKNADHPRGYYKCSVSKGCPAKKRVERCTDDPTNLMITYENDHNHPVGAAQAHSA